MNPKKSQIFTEKSYEYSIESQEIIKINCDFMKDLGT